MDPADVRSGFVNPPQQITTSGTHVNSHAVSLPGGDVLVVYPSRSVGDVDVFMKRAPFAALADTNTVEIPVAATDGAAEDAPFLALSGGLVTVFFRQSTGATTHRWQYRRWQHATGTWFHDDIAGPSQLPTTADAYAPDFHAAVDTSGQVWAAFRPKAGWVQALRFNPATGLVTQEEPFDTTTDDRDPFVLCTRGGDVWVYWSGDDALYARRFRNNVWEEPEQIPAIQGSASSPCAVEQADGAIWLFWALGDVGSADLAAVRRDPVSGGWGPLRQLVTSSGDDSGPFALVAPDDAIWIFWASNRSGTANIYGKRLLTAV
ncbi:hypothetical protein [Streptomyces sp. NPDC056512]|uniref:hypothetical protein n=1 Tax=Streptomyces sp. NPDC056512 TaxID=3345846 RepID=UPI0036B9CEF8